MNVKIIALNAYTDEPVSGNVEIAHGVHLSKAAWDASRPGSDTPLEDILSIDAPVNEMPSAILKIRSSAVIREVITAIREHIMWATTSRTTTIEALRNFEVPESFTGKKYDERFESIRRDISAAKTILSQDDARLFLPALHITEYMVRLSLRSLVKLWHQFHTFSYSAGTGASALMFTRAANALDKVIDELSPGVDIQSKIKYTPLLHSVGFEEEFGRKNEGPRRIHDVVSIRLIAPFSLRTHITRHRMLGLRDNLLDFICGDISTLRLNTLMRMEVFADVSTWRNVIKMRSCWIAQFNLWKKIITPISNILGCMKSLPCDDGVCPYAVDAERRLGSDDPGLPCPIYLRLKDISISRETAVKMREHVRIDGRDNFWYSEIERME